MIGRLTAGLILGLPLFMQASLLPALVMPAGQAAALFWLVLLISVPTAFVIALKAPSFRNACSRLLLIDGILALVVAAISLFSRASAAQEEFHPEYISEAAARYVVQAFLTHYAGVFAFAVALVLIAASLLLMRSRHI
jgi:hypothetical protein